MEICKESWGYEVSGSLQEVKRWIEENEGRLDRNAEVVISVINSGEKKGEEVS